MLIYLALVSAVAYTLWGCLLKHNPVSRVTIFGFLTPVFGVVLSALLLSEGGALGWSALGALVSGLRGHPAGQPPGGERGGAIAFQDKIFMFFSGHFHENLL